MSDKDKNGYSHGYADGLQHGEHGIEQLRRENENLRRVNRWISVDESLPPFYETVLIVTPGEPRPVVGMLDKESRRWRKAGEKGLYQATHWRPWPELPTGSTDSGGATA